MNLVHFSHKICHLVATILMIFPRVHYAFAEFRGGHRFGPPLNTPLNTGTVAKLKSFQCHNVAYNAFLVITSPTSTDNLGYTYTKKYVQHILHLIENTHALNESELQLPMTSQLPRPVLVLDPSPVPDSLNFQPSRMPGAATDYLSSQRVTQAKRNELDKCKYLSIVTT